MRTIYAGYWLLLAAAILLAQDPKPVELRIRADQPGVQLSPLLYGLMTEEINYSYDGGLYAELIRNRSMKENASEPVHWQLVQEKGGRGSMALDAGSPLNAAIPTSLKLTVDMAAGGQQVGVSNDGFWGIPVRPGTRYHASFYAKADSAFSGPLTISVVSKDGATVLASAKVPRITAEWHKYEVMLTTPAKATASSENRFVISAGHAGTIWLNMISLFPPTYANRANGNRKDIMQLLADMHPALLRFPGGNYLEGNTIATRFNWKETIGDVAQRPGHLNDAWKYWSSDGMGLLEFLNWCEDLHLEPVLAVYAGYSLHQERVAAGPDLEPYVKDALDEIEYVTGDANSTWGARRANDGHPAPFQLQYVEVGNEDQFDKQSGSYGARFAQFFDAIRSKYPRLKIISTTATSGRTPDVIDEHYYRRSEDEMASHSHDYDARPRTGPKVFVGEWATRVGEPTPNMSAALGDAAWMTGMERNSDLVIMSSYAPLFVNVNPGGMQWKTDLIGYDAMSSYGSPGYWAQQMFSTNHGDRVVPIETDAIPTKMWQPPPPRVRPGDASATPPPTPPAQQVPLVFFSVTRDSKTGTLYVKVVNRAGTAQSVHFALRGVASVERTGKLLAMTAGSPDDTNSITAPAKIVPVASNAEGLSDNFSRTFPPYSISVLQIRGK